MSVEDQKRFLTKLHNELSVSSQDYRDQTANKRKHVFVVTRRKMRQGIRDRLVKNYPGISKAVMSKILKDSDKFIRALIRSTGANVRDIQAREGKEMVHSLKFTPARVEAVFEADGTDRFGQIKRTYDKDWQTAAAGVIEAVKSNLKVADASIEAKSLWNLEHAHLKGIIETQVKDAIDNALLEEEQITRAKVNNFFKGMGIDLAIVRNGSTGTMEVFMGSQRANAKAGGISGAKVKKLKEALVMALAKLDGASEPLADLGGSDSFRESKTKKARRRVMNSFKGVNNTTVTSKNLKANDSKTHIKKKITQTTVVGKNAMKKKRIRSVVQKKKAGASSQPLQMITLLNKELPDVVKKNMREPALVNRTGTFAESVQVTEITKTPKGFPSIGYTYKRDPYQVFESGSGDPRWSTPERDPRAVIDKSIREIAAQFALGRYFTRRI